MTVGDVPWEGDLAVGRGFGFDSIRYREIVCAGESKLMNWRRKNQGWSDMGDDCVLDAIERRTRGRTSTKGRCESVEGQNGDGDSVHQLINKGWESSPLERGVEQRQRQWLNRRRAVVSLA